MEGTRWRGLFSMSCTRIFISSRTVIIIMSIDKRYEAFLGDLFSLFEQFTIRTLSQREINIDKFKFFFNKFYDRLQSIEQSFHQNKLKLTKHLQRLRENCKLEGKTGRNHQSISSSQDNKSADKPIPKPFVRSISAAKPSQVSKELISIEEEDDQYRTPRHDRRSETAGGTRKSSLGNREQYRPLTGQAGGRRRYMETEKQAKTINITEQAFCNTEESNSSKQFTRVHYVLDDREIKSKKKNFYLQLQKQKSKEGQILSDRECKQMFKKYKGKANQRIWQKINRLL